MRRFSDVYGDSPGHLVVMLGCIAVSAYAASFLLGDPALLTVLVWFVGAALVHDMLLFPLYAVADRGLTTVAGLLPRMRVPIVNHVRIPALAAGLTLLMFLPGIIRQGEGTHLAATGLDQAPYFERWLGLVAAVVLTSAVIYAIRVVAGSRGAAAEAGDQPQPPLRHPDADPLPPR
jgi:hypothetical protein